MKKRNGFVSNSSSSSFIIDYSNISRVATSMLNTVIEDWGDSDHGGDRKTHLKWRENLQWGLVHSKVKSGKIGITMPSCNYETYIFLRGNKVYISTANNHSWDIEGMGGSSYRGIGSDDEDYDEVHRYVKDLDYYNIQNGLIHSYHQYFDYSSNRESPEKLCPYCNRYPYEYVIYKKEKLCTQCYKGILGTKKTIEWKIDEEEAELQRVKLDLKLRESTPVDPIQDVEIHP